MRDHGGNLDQAMARYGGAEADWIDLSTGINPRPYPVPTLDPRAWRALPTRADMNALEDAARKAYRTDWAMVALAGAQAAIQMVPGLRPPGKARVLSPTYNEHAACLRAAAWDVRDVASASELGGADLAIVVNPNNPDGRSQTPDALRSLAREVGLLVVDESFADITPELTLLTGPCPGNVLVLRSFGKFFGQAGVRLGFALGGQELVAALRAHAGPWPVSGPAIALGRAGLADVGWQTRTRARLAQDAARLDHLASGAGWDLVGGTDLFRTYRVPGAQEVQNGLARSRIWSRAFAYAPDWLRLGLPDGADAWARLETALARAGK